MRTTSAERFIVNRLIEYAAGTPSSSEIAVETKATQKLLTMNWP
jgi:hypothetical protein